MSDKDPVAEAALRALKNTSPAAAKKADDSVGIASTKPDPGTSEKKASRSSDPKSTKMPEKSSAEAEAHKLASREKQKNDFKNKTLPKTTLPNKGSAEATAHRLAAEQATAKQDGVKSNGEPGNNDSSLTFLLTVLLLPLVIVAGLYAYYSQKGETNTRLGKVVTTENATSAPKVTAEPGKPGEKTTPNPKKEAASPPSGEATSKSDNKIAAAVPKEAPVPKPESQVKPQASMAAPATTTDVQKPPQTANNLATKTPETPETPETTPTPTPTPAPAPAPASPTPAPTPEPALTPAPSTPDSDPATASQTTPAAKAKTNAAQTTPSPQADHKTGQWDYRSTDWAALDPAYKTCGTGRQQSPINIPSTAQGGNGPVFVYNYMPSGSVISNSGHGIKVTLDKGNRLLVNGAPYELKQFHFHTPSEHQLNGKTYPMEIHFVHQNAEGQLAVVAVMVETGGPNWLLKQLPIPPGKGAEIERKGRHVNPAQLLPGDRSFFTFNGSLTTPPCTENVGWIVLKTPLQISPETLAKFEQAQGKNNRPLQALNGRLIYGSQ